MNTVLKRILPKFAIAACLLGGCGLTAPVAVANSGDRAPLHLASSIKTPKQDSEAVPEPFPSFYSEQLDQQLLEYVAYINKFGAPDILIVGSSRALWGVDPIALQKALAKRGYPNFRIYNFGINGATAQVVDVLLRRLFPPEQLPKLIIWADGSRAFNSGRRDRTYEKLTVSPGYRLLLSGTRPIPAAPKVVEIAQLCTDFIEPLLRFTAVLNEIAGVASASQVSSVCEQPKAVLVRAVEPVAPELLESQGNAGFEPVFKRFNPASYFQKFPRVAGIYDGDYRAFNLEGRQTTAFRNTLRHVRSHKVPVVYVNLPLTRVYLDSARTAYEQQFSRFMQRFANYGLLTFYDLRSQWPTQHHYYVDPSHLNRYGATAVSQYLGRRLILPAALENQRLLF